MLPLMTKYSQEFNDDVWVCYSKYDTGFFGKCTSNRRKYLCLDEKCTKSFTVTHFLITNHPRKSHLKIFCSRKLEMCLYSSGKRDLTFFTQSCFYRQKKRQNRKFHFTIKKAFFFNVLMRPKDCMILSLRPSEGFRCSLTCLSYSL